MSTTFTNGQEGHNWPCPEIEPVIAVPMFGKQFPVMHMQQVLVMPVQDPRVVVLAIGHSQADYGTFMSFTAEQARNVATWFLSAADHLDGGVKG